MGRAEDDALRRAIVDDDLERAEELLRAGADPDVVVGVIRAKSPYLNPCFAPNQFRGLHLAANDDDPELAALLLLHGANAHSPIYAGALPISIAAQSNHLKTAKLLLHEYRRPAGTFAYCPLRVASYRGHLAMVELLLGTKPEEMGIDAALGSAVSKKDNLAVTERLLAAGARASWVHPGRAAAETVTTRMLALRSQPEALPLLVGHGQVRLIDAAIDGDLDAVKRFLLAGSSPDEADPWGHTTALSAASRCGRAAVVDHLIEVGAQLYGPKKKADPLFDALRGGHTATADRLWSAGCRTRDMVERTILLGLPFESVRWAFERVPEPGVGRALYAAARSRRIDVARFALERGADPSHRHSDRSPLMVAASRRQVELMELLIAHGADVHAVDGEGRTAMHYALFAGELDDPDDGPFDYTDDALERPAVKLLLRHGLLVPPRAT